MFLRYFSIFFQETLLFLDKCDTLYNMNLKEEIKIGRYRHFKGKEYEVLFLAKHSETGEEMVVYKALYGSCEVWVRPASMWLENVERDGKVFPRFTYIEK